MSNDTLDTKIQQLLADLREVENSGLDDADRAAVLEVQGYEDTFMALRDAAETEWRLANAERDDRGSASAGQAAAQRQTPLDRLLEYLPQAHALASIEATLARLRGQEPPPTTTIADAFQALMAGNWNEALRCMARAGDSTEVRAAVLSERVGEAERLIAEARRRKRALPHAEAGEEGRRSIRRELLEPARRIGTARQQARIDRFFEPRSRSIWAVPVAAVVLILAIGGGIAQTDVRCHIPGVGAMICVPPPIALATPPNESATATATATNTPTATATTAPTATATASPSPEPAPEPVDVGAITPTEIFSGTQLPRLSVRGSGLDQVRTAELTATGHLTIALTIEQAEPKLLTLALPAALPEPVSGTLTYTLQLDGQPQDQAHVVFHDYIGRTVVKGVKPEYAGRTTPARVATGADSYTTLRKGAIFDNSRVDGGQLRNGDEVDILRDDVAGWYRVRIRKNRVEGWVERWLVDDVGVPPPPTPGR